MARKRNGRRNADQVERKDQSGATSKSKERYDQISGPTGSKPGDPGDASKAEVPSDKNDPEWYNADPALLLDSASFPYAYPLGDVVNLNFGESGGSFNMAEANYHAISGLCTLRIKPTYGRSRDMKDALNVCANAFYTHVRYVNSGRKNYDASDLMLYALFWADVYSAIFWAQRLYAIAFTYSQRNKYLGRALLKANGVDADDFYNNLANFRYRLNSYINKVSSFVVPANINIFKRRAFMYTGLYLENRDNNIKDQLYMFVPDGFYKFALDADGKGMLEYNQLYVESQGLYTTTDVIDILEGLLSNIMGDEDFGLMSGDILKAYGTNIIGLSSMAEEQYIMPMHDPFVLSQFKNASICNWEMMCYGSRKIKVRESADDTHFTTTGDLCQDMHGKLKCTEAVNVNTSGDYPKQQFSRYLNSNKLISVENPTPGPADSIEASRLIVSEKAFTKTQAAEEKYGYTVGQALHVLVTGSEFVVQANNYHFDTATEDLVWFRQRGNIIGVPSGSASFNDINGSGTLAEQTLCALQFKYAPLLIAWRGSVSSGTIKITDIYPLSNIDNYTLVSHDEISKMHECALLSLFFVPGVAKMVNYM